ncbi:MAG: SHOCT domain-containing protein [Undibacterium sp.]|nr:SHOCT domain-containing protein [Opitutaceae bacterium]
MSAGSDTYTVSASAFGGFSTNDVRNKVYKDANDFCAAKGLVMVPVSFKARPGELGRDPTSADLAFRALKPGDPAIGRPDVVDVDQNVTVNQNVKVSVKDEIKKEKPPDTYTELNKLDDLRKRGLSSEAEFETEKRKLLQPK